MDPCTHKKLRIHVVPQLVTTKPVNPASAAGSTENRTRCANAAGKTGCLLPPSWRISKHHTNKHMTEIKGDNLQLISGC